METTQTLYLNLFGEDKIPVLKEVSIYNNNCCFVYIYICMYV